MLAASANAHNSRIHRLRTNESFILTEKIANGCAEFILLVGVNDLEILAVLSGGHDVVGIDASHFGEVAIHGAKPSVSLHVIFNPRFPAVAESDGCAFLEFVGGDGFHYLIRISGVERVSRDILNKNEFL